MKTPVFAFVFFSFLQPAFADVGTPAVKAVCKIATMKSHTGEFVTGSLDLRKDGPNKLVAPISATRAVIVQYSNHTITLGVVDVEGYEGKSDEIIGLDRVLFQSESPLVLGRKVKLGVRSEDPAFTHLLNCLFSN
jgi:hypothetical protein